MFTIDYLQPLTTAIEDKIKLERMQYSDIYDVIETHLATSVRDTKQEHAIMIGSTMGINLLLQKPRSIDDFVYELYSEDAFAHANELVNKIHTAIADKYIILLKTSIPNIKYQIMVNLRMLVTIFRTADNSYDLVIPVLVDTFDKKRKVLVVSPEIQLIDIYRTLYSPNQVDEWKRTLQDETKLFQHLNSRITNEIVGGDEPTMPERKTIEFNLMKEFIADNSGVVLVGEHALKLMINAEIKTSVIQIISQNDINDDFQEIEKIIKKSLKRNLPIIKVTRDLNVMQDFRIRRTIIKVGDPQKEIMYIYNSANYDLIPFNGCVAHDKAGKSVIQIGNPFVLLRFLLIDFWMIRLIKHYGQINDAFAKQRQDSIISKILVIRKHMQTADHKIHPKFFDSYDVETNAVFKIFQSKDYIGFYDDEIISQKIIIKDLTKKFYDYYPSEYKSKNGAYREITHKSARP